MQPTVPFDWKILETQSWRELEKRLSFKKKMSLIGHLPFEMYLDQTMAQSCTLLSWTESGPKQQRIYLNNDHNKYFP